ncbi:MULTISPECIES: LLM class flavin-dependent oxidoreductase [Streptomyces]|uniref:LLM class flavin-dependent oxidoreductase n=1 Tax=Streptomyces lienomycini TaxID=284035 RepID=A0ABV9X109_9ACTN|nr:MULTISPECIES: LLM class flavin-dependent oxidoreductase [Streptomyces]
MTFSHARRRLHLAAALDRRSVRDADEYAADARLAERGALDFVTLGDGPAAPDALAVLSRVAPGTRRVGLVPTVTTTRAEPFRVQAAVATLDRVSRGRAGWRIEVSTTEGEARLLCHQGSALSVGDASALPRPPQGHPVRVVDATDRPARAVAARYADVALVRAVLPAQAAAARDELRASAAAHGRDPDALRILAALDVDLGDGECAADPCHGGGPRPTPRGPLYRGGPIGLAELIAAWHRDGTVDGFHVTPVDPRRDLERLVNGTVSLLQHRGLFRTFYPGSTLRDHLDLARPANGCAPARGVS